VEHVNEQLRRDFTELFQQHYPRVLGFLLRRLGELSSAEDCAAETFAIAWSKSSSELVSPAWLFVTARQVMNNRIRQHLRSNQLHQRIASELASGSQPYFVPPPDTVDPATEQLLAALDQLKADQRELVIAHYWDGLTARELAEMADCSIRAIWMRLHRARRALADQLHTEPPHSTVTTHLTKEESCV
jgi:RNA polymerase sigma-70 factor (ECF subfamily)